jgi:m7GpppX diphosphatase
LIHPATPAHISKYTRQERFLVAESPYLYESVVRPWIDSHAAARIKWIDNILNGISEQDKLLYRNTDPDTGFVLLPDSKWDQRSLSSLYLLAITMRRDIHSLRDLSEKHLPVLKEMQKVMASKIHEQYNLDPKKLRFYVHYLPTYYYFHIHVVHVDLETPGCAIGAAHLLDDIIDNIENISGDYYQRKTMHYYIGSEHELYRSVIKDKQ